MKGMIVATWKNGILDLEVHGNMSPDLLNLVCDMVKDHIVKQLAPQKGIPFMAREIP